MDAGSGGGHSPSEQEQVAQLARALRSDITLVLRTLEDILDKFALLEVLVPRVRRAVAAAEAARCDDGEAPAESPCAGTESALSSVMTAGDEPEHTARPAKITPEDIALVDVHQETEQQRQEPSEEGSGAAAEQQQEDAPATTAPPATATVPQEPAFKKKLRWLLNKLFPTQQRFNPDDPFIQQTLCDMGFTDEARNAQALHDYNGVMPRVLDALLTTSSDSGSDSSSEDGKEGSE